VGLADAPELYGAMAGLEKVLAQSPLEKPLRHLVKLRASVINGCAYCVDMHTHDALAEGEDQRRLFAVSAWQESPLFSDRERAAFALTDAVTKLHDVDPAYEAAAEHFDPQEMIALLYLITTINGWNRLCVATHAVYEPPAS
jgi:AhpD family alkylhydroperoxidase